jgi:hypothetical protein
MSGFYCKRRNKEKHFVTWLFIKNAWLPVIAVCHKEILLPRTTQPVVPNITDLDLEVSGYVFTLNWTPNSFFKTKIEYKSSASEEWITLIYDKGIAEADIDFEGIYEDQEDIDFRLSFLDEGSGIVSADYATTTGTINLPEPEPDVIPDVENLSLSVDGEIAFLEWNPSELYLTTVEYMLPDSEEWVTWADSPFAVGTSSVELDFTNVG